MYEVLEILKYTIPALIVFLTSFLSFRFLIKREEKNKKYELLLNNQKYISGMRLQAYERIILFLERISPESMLKRVHKRGMTARQLQNELLSTITGEFEHNFSQQIYITPESWQMAVKAKENIVKLINTTAANFKPDTASIHLSKAILEKVMEMDQKPVAPALQYIRKEVQQLF